jgi:hypothetical protein
VVLLRLASRLQTLRWFAASKTPGAQQLAAEAVQVFAPLANRLGIWQIKWELEDLAFRFLDPESYHAIARQLDERRADREARIGRLRAELEADLLAHGLQAQVQGRPKHLYSIWKKMKKKGLAFGGVMDMLALRVIVPDVAGCYAVLARVHERWHPIAGEFDDYIARPKANGYRSLHTVVQGDDDRPVEIQIRTQEMHEHAEYGVSAHWAYKRPTSPAAGAAARPAGASRPASPRRGWWCCASCSPGSTTSPRARAMPPSRVRPPRPASRPSTTASTSSRRRRPWSSSPPGRRRSISRTPCTPISATAAAAPRSTAGSCRWRRRCKAGRRSRSPSPRAAARRSTGSIPSSAT